MLTFEQFEQARQEALPQFRCPDELLGRIDECVAGVERFRSRAECDEPLEDLLDELLDTAADCRAALLRPCLEEADESWSRLERLAEEFARRYAEESCPMCSSCGEPGDWRASECGGCGAA